MAKHGRWMAELRSSNQDLSNALKKTELPADDDSPKVRELKKKFSLQRCDAIRQSLDALHRALESRMGCACSAPHQAVIDLDWVNFEANTAREFQVALSFSTETRSSDMWQRFNVTNTTILPPELNAPAPEGLCQPCIPSPCARKKVSFWSKMESLRGHHLEVQSPTTRQGSSSFSPISSPSPPPVTGSITANSATEHIHDFRENEPPFTICSAVVSQSHSVNKNPDFFAIKDPSPVKEAYIRRFSLKYSPSGSTTILQALSLRSILSSSLAELYSSPLHFSPHPNAQKNRHREADAAIRHRILYPKQRYGIAASVAWSVLHMGGTSWVNDDNNKNGTGRRWDPETQTRIFLERTQNGSEQLTRFPCAGYTFSGCSTTPPSTGSNGFDNHQGLIRNRTIFNLGILLIELALDTPFTVLREIYQNSSQVPVTKYSQGSSRTGSVICSGLRSKSESCFVSWDKKSILSDGWLYSVTPGVS